MNLPILLVTLAITLAILPSIIIRYAAFSKVVTKAQKQTLFKAYLLCFLVQTILMFLFLYHNSNTIRPLFYKTAIMLFGTIYFIINCLVIKGMFFKHIFVIGMQGSFSIVLNALAAMTLRDYANSLPVNQYLIFHTLVYILLFFILSFPLWHFLKNSFVIKLSRDHDYYWNIIWLIPISLFIGNVIITVDNEWVHTWKQLVARLCTGFTIFILWKCVNLDFKELEEKFSLITQNRLLRMQMDAINNEAAAITEHNKKMSILRHDLRHHVHILSSLIDNHELEAARELLTRLNDDLESTRPIVFCKNSIINAALLVYISKAHKEQIEVISEIDIPKEIPWDESDIALLFANVLENAIHASQHQDPGQKKIIITTRYADRKLAILVENRFDGDIEFGEDKLPMSREENHGIGMTSIHSIVSKYHGHLSCSHEQGCFSIRFLFAEHFTEA